MMKSLKTKPELQSWKNKDLRIEPDERYEGRVAWRSPANIALIKYWGKKPVQIPENPSLSFALNNSYTETNIQYRSLRGRENTIEFSFEGKPAPEFARRIEKYFKLLGEYLPFLEQLHFSITSKNTFPHSSGIASSASAFSSLALCLCSMERDLFGTLKDETEFYQKASFLARLGSGSASRSVYPGFVVWGNHASLPASSDEYAIPLSNIIHKKFNRLKDAILIVNSVSKKVSSSSGHHLMDLNPFAEARYRQANLHLEELLKILETGDFENFAKIVEAEALSLHAMMMGSDPSFLLLDPGSVAIIRNIRNFREQKGHQLCFTIDAGPNIHLLYNEEDEKAVEKFINEELLPHCENRNWINDQMGKGPLEL